MAIKCLSYNLVRSVELWEKCVSENNTKFDTKLYEMSIPEEDCNDS